MPDPIRQESPLARFELAERATRAPGKAGVLAAEQAFLGHLDLRGEPGEAAFLEAVQAVTGLALPLAPNTVAEAEGVTACWLGPDEWLLITPGEREAELAAALREALAGHHHALTALSGGQTVLRLAGARVRELLAKGCPLDLHPRVFGPGQCAQTLFAKAPVLLRQIDAAPSFELVVRRSFADYLWLWLEDAAAEYGLAVLAAPAPAAAKPGPARRTA